MGSPSPSSIVPNARASIPASFNTMTMALAANSLRATSSVSRWMSSSGMFTPASWHRAAGRAGDPCSWATPARGPIQNPPGYLIDFDRGGPARFNALHDARFVHKHRIGGVIRDRDDREPEVLAQFLLGPGLFERNLDQALVLDILLNQQFCTRPAEPAM